MSETTKHIEVILPPLFKYKTRYCVLENGVRGLLVEDSDANISGIGVGVHAGSYNDPEGIDGLAHFTEHMLFLGTSKYPEEGSYDKFISSNGGYNNAYTASTSTAYYCTINVDKLDEALDRVSQFFISPLFTESVIDREIHAIDSEFNRSRESESQKLSSVVRAICSPKNPYHRFSIGNLSTLGSNAISVTDLQSALRSFVDRYYRPDALGVTIISCLPLDDQEALLRKYFTPIPARESECGFNIDARLWNELGDPAEMFPLGSRVFTAPPGGDETQKFVILWPMEPLNKGYYKKNPLGYYVHLLGHETEGSVANYLREKGLSHSLTTSVIHEETLSIVKCEVVLTSEGWKHKDDVANVIFAYTSMLRKLGPQEWVFNEKRDQDQVDFMFCSKESTLDFVSNIFDYFFEHGPEDIYTHTIADDWDPALIAKIGEYLTPSRCFIVYSAKEYADMPGASRTPHYDVSYKVEPMDAALVARWNAADPEEFGLHLPERNPFISDPKALAKLCTQNNGDCSNNKDDADFDSFDKILSALSTSVSKNENKEYSIEAPREILRTDHSIFYLKEDTYFNNPVIQMYFRITSALQPRSSRDYAGIKLLLILFKIICKKWDYFAELSGDGNVLSSTMYNFGFTSAGYSDKQYIYSRRVFSELISITSVSPTTLAVAQEKCVRRIAKWRANTQPTSTPSIAFSFLCKEIYYSTQESIDAILAFTPESFSEWITGFWAAGISVSSIIIGRTTAAEARAFAEDIDKLAASKGPAFPASEHSNFPYRVIQPGCTVINIAPLVDSNPNSCVSDFYFITQGLKYPDDIMENTCAGILVDLVEPSFYATLRTKEQLGYTIWFYTDVEGYRVLKAVIQSSDYSPDYIEERMQTFFSDYYNTLKELSDKEFEEVKRGYITKVLQPPSSIQSEAFNLSNEFLKGSFLWDRKKVVAELAKGVTKKQVVELYERVLLNKDTRRMVSFRVHAKAHQTPETPKLVDVCNPEKGFFECSKEWPFVDTRPGPWAPEPTTAGLTLSSIKK